MKINILWGFFKLFWKFLLDCATEVASAGSLCCTWCRPLCHSDSATCRQRHVVCIREEKVGTSSASAKRGVSLRSAEHHNLSCGIWSLSLRDLHSGELLDSALSWIGALKTRVDTCEQNKMKDVLKEWNISWFYSEWVKQISQKLQTGAE